MPEKKTIARAKRDKAQGKAPSTQAGEFVREEIEHIREGKHGARSAKQAIAIGLSKARRAGVKLGAPKTGSAASKKAAVRVKPTRKKPSPKRSRATTKALKKEGRAAASPRALSRHAHAAATKRKNAGLKARRPKKRAASAKK